jgi:isoleucyl-tRNA synthetase
MLYLLEEYKKEISEGYDSDKDRYVFHKAYKSIYDFCNNEVSSFYLDVLKDRLYTHGKNSVSRRAAQTVIYEILDTIIRVIAPILSFTADEIWQYMPKRKEEKNVASVHLLDWSKYIEKYHNQQIADDFRKIYSLRNDILKSLEEERSGGKIGSSLEAKLALTLGSELYPVFDKYLKDLPSLFIVSQLELKEAEGDSYKIEVLAADGEKCSRCWNYRTDVGKDKEHPSICMRCVGAVKENC